MFKFIKENKEENLYQDAYNKVLEINKIDNDIVANLESLKLVLNHELFRVDNTTVLCPRHELEKLIENYEHLELMYKELLNNGTI